MDNKKLSDNLKILSKNKGFINALIFLLVVLFLWLVLTRLIFPITIMAIMEVILMEQLK